MMKHISMSVITILIAIISTGCVTQNAKTKKTESKQISIEEQKRIEIDRERELVKQRLLQEQKVKRTNEKVNQIIKAKAVDIKSFDINKYFGKGLMLKGRSKGEFESKDEYIKRLKSIISPTKIYYFDIKAKFGRYDLDNQNYKLYAPEVMKKIPTAFSKSMKKYYEYIDPSLSVYGYDDKRGKLLWLALKNNEVKKTYSGSNSFGAEATVLDIEKNQWGLALIFNEFSDMEYYGTNLIFNKGKYDFQDAILLEVPVEKAKTSNINTSDITVRMGVTFTYGVRDLAVATSFPDGYGHTPTVSEPWKISGYNYILAADLNSICLIKQKNKEAISCRLHVEQ